MVYCQAFGCSNCTGKTSGKSFHRFPDPQKCPELFKRWVAVLKVEKFQGKNVKHDRKNDVICSDHFTETDYLVDLRAKLITMRYYQLPALRHASRSHRSTWRRCIYSREQSNRRIQSTIYILSIVKCLMFLLYQKLFRILFQINDKCLVRLILL